MKEPFTGVRSEKDNERHCALEQTNDDAAARRRRRRISASNRAMKSAFGIALTAQWRPNSFFPGNHDILFVEL